MMDPSKSRLLLSLVLKSADSEDDASFEQRYPLMAMNKLLEHNVYIGGFVTLEFEGQNWS